MTLTLEIILVSESVTTGCWNIFSLTESISHKDRHRGTFAEEHNPLDGPFHCDSSSLKPACQSDTPDEFQESIFISVPWELMCVSRSVRTAARLCQQSDLLLLLTTHCNETMPQPVSKSVSSDVKVQPPLPKHNLWFSERQTQDFFFFLFLFFLFSPIRLVV